MKQEEKKIIFLPFEMKKVFEWDKKGKTLWLRGYYGTWFSRTANQLEMSTSKNKIELCIKGLLESESYLSKEAKNVKKYEKSLMLQKKATLLQNVVLGTTVGFKKKLRLRFGPAPSEWQCNDRHPQFEVNGGKIASRLKNIEKEKYELRKKKTYLAALITNTYGRDKNSKNKKDRQEVKKLKENLLWDFKTQRYNIRKKEKASRTVPQQPRVQVKSKSVISLGAFIKKIRNKERPNFYTGKGIRYYKDIVPNRAKKKDYVKRIQKKEKVSRASRTMGKRPNLWA